MPKTRQQSIKKILSINPWVTDFAFYDLWFKPVGLLYLSTILKNYGMDVSFIDCIQKYIGKRKYGKGKIYHEEIALPEALNKFKMRYFRYGITENEFKNKLKEIDKPDIILITSFMTYWYPGILLTAKTLKKHFPDTKIVLGGIYATLLPEHARALENIDYVITGNNFNSIIDSIFEVLNIHKGTFPGINTLDDLPFIDYSLYKSLDSITTVNSLGCPFECTYCASSILYKKFQYKSSKYINNEFKRYMAYNVSDITFYDDAFLMHPEIIKILKILKLFPFKYHLPNGIHAKFITPRIAKLLFDAGFKTIRIGYEVYDSLLQNKMGGKVTNKILKNAIDYLNNAGYFSGEIGVYVLGGHPKIPINALENSIKYLSDMGVRIYISEYSPVPKTSDGKLYYKKESDPLLTNNSLRRFINDKDKEKYFDLKCFIRIHNSKVAGNHPATY